MFRKPRDSANGVAEQLGRPPSPSAATRADLPPSSLPAPASLRSKDMALGGSRLPLAGGNATRRVQATPKVKGKGGSAARPNGSILSFFKKTNLPEHSGDSYDDGDGLFISDNSFQTEDESPSQIPTPPKEDELILGIGEESRFNEVGGTVKRRKTGTQLLGRSFSPENQVKDTERKGTEYVVQNVDYAELGPQEMDRLSVSKSPKDEVASESRSCSPDINAPGKEPGEGIQHMRSGMCPEPPSLARESTSGFFQDAEEDEIYDEEALAELGEEFLERRYAEEQARLEREANQEESESAETEPAIDLEEIQEPCTLGSDAPPCPICNIALAGITDEQASTHVNNCIDGRPSPLPKAAIQPPGVKPEPPPPAKRFMKAAIARPGQQNPFKFGGEATNSDQSAFSKLMSGHAEDTAWAAAAANEVASRGKPAFKRTCPFYKILPGFSICVDAFRYGAVQGCSAYFLSHFHSDHYIGLTSSWCHGPIYCSKVTANLVKQQLRVDHKYVVALEFEEKVEVPGTNGVHVTMIPANHCPGSSLFLYEKPVSKAPNSKLHRVLHCGDFRACPAHVQHPLLRPDVIDAVSGKRREQKLNVCYLDTTYCTPKYSFPLQHEVIQACADMCISLSKEHLDENDDWEKVKKARAGAGMVKFTQAGSSDIGGDHEKELDEDGNVIAYGKESANKTRGRLLVIVGTYSIGKERICLGIAKALNSKIYATSGKQRICAALEDPELTSRLTSNPLEAQVHMQMIMEIRPETLADYLASYKPHFSRIVGFRPSGWNYRPPNSRFTESPLVQTVLHSDNWKSRYSMHELMPQRGSTREAACFGVPYSEHSSFRELSMFCCALRIDKIIPTVNIGSAKSRERMKGWFEKWDQEKKKNGLFKIADGATAW